MPIKNPLIIRVDNQGRFIEFVSVQISVTAYC